MRADKRFMIITDLEGVAGVDSFSQTRSAAEAAKLPGMIQLTKEVNACVEGLLSVFPGAAVDVWDGHGSGGMIAADLKYGNYIRPGVRPYMEMAGYDAMLFVGQHAMAGTVNAPLCHTYSSLTIAYYRWNGIFVGEFGARTIVAGLQGVPVIYLAGDDKAALEAQMMVPEIVTTAVKRGLGWEAAEHLTSEEACRRVREGAAEAARRFAAAAFTPVQVVKEPFVLEVRYINPVNRERVLKPGLHVIDERTVQYRTSDFHRLPV
ncbi:MAG TPA: M55 family metallopeptidase [Firmicutes bacterium]|nr:M55 family metallopeptidase [Bacillota bacterium]